MANELIKGMGFHHIALKAKDFEKSRAFYTALGMKEIVSWGEGSNTITMFDVGDGGRIELFANGGDEFSVNGKWVHFALSVDDVKAAYELALKAGASPLTPPKTVPLQSRPYLMTIEVAFVLGPDGEQVEFFKQI